MRFNYKSLIIWAVLLVILFVIFNLSKLTEQNAVEEIDMTTFLNRVGNGEVKQVEIDGVEYKGSFVDGKQFIAIGPSGEEVMKILADKKVIARYKKPEDNSLLQAIFASWLPMIILIAFFVFFMRQLQGGSGKAFTFGKSKHRVISKDKNPITFKDVAGVDESKEELEEIVDFLRRPQSYTRMGAKIPRGVLLVGAPGTGKTLLAKAIAGEASVPFFSISGSDFVEMFVGVGASRVRDLFQQAKSSAPCIVFVDEIDAVGRQRGAGLGGGHDEREQTLNQLLVEMDGFGTDAGVIVMAATNRPDVLDPALLRPGRFDRQVYVPMPDVRGREEILKVHINSIRHDDGVDLARIARGTPGFSGADLANLLNEAALLAAKRGKEKVGMAEVEEAKDKVLMGKERRSLVLTDDEKRVTAYHETGHAVVGYFTPGSDPIYKISIIPRGRALGVTQMLPEKDRYDHTREELVAKVSVLMGGRCAEELFLGKVTTGAGNDIERASRLVRSMVMNWGMSPEMGPINYGEHEEEVFLGRELTRRAHMSEYTAERIDREIHRIITEAYNAAAAILNKHRGKVEAMVALLMEKETIQKDDVDAIFGDPKAAEAPAEPISPRIDGSPA
ncbi:MAG TPA: ATP-dependent zinc metalloprotease FtsH [bacterium]|nr:ATP-dependent zinc metalloprotease FtsH [bacterium]